MKWVLIVTWITVNPSGLGSGLEITTWNSLDECHKVGQLAQKQFDALYSDANGASTTNFSCNPSIDIKVVNTEVDGWKFFRPLFFWNK